MIKIFQSGHFHESSNVRLDNARGPIVNRNICGWPITTVFISHKHEDLEDLKGVLGYLETKYKVRVYIDGWDPTMPKQTSGETASRLKNRIRQCDKFIMLATNGAVESKWCNWELGYGDADKFEKDSIAILPIKPRSAFDSDYRGHEYMAIYPHIAYYEGTEYRIKQSGLTKGYYIVKTLTDGSTSLEKLESWLNRR